MIEQIRFDNFKSFAFNEPITLPRFFVLVGDNGAGKTNFCDAFDFTRDVLERGLREALLDERRGGFDNIVRGRDSKREITCRFTFRGVKGPMACQRLEYQFSVGLSGRKGQPMILNERLVGTSDEERTNYLDRTAGSSYVRNELAVGFDEILEHDHSPAEWIETWEAEPDYLQVARLTDERRFPALRCVRDALRSVLVLRPNPHALRQAATVGGELRLGSGGEGLAAILDAADISQLDQLAALLREGDCFTESIRLLPAKPGQKVIGVLERGQKEPYRPEQISDGTLRLLAMLAAITGAAPSISTLVIEEPENGIHFSRLSRLVELCRQRVQKDPNVQIILTTHSVPLLHALQREEAMAVARQNEVSEILAPPDKDKWERFREEAGYTIGDLYTTGLWPDLAPRRYTP